MLIVFNKSKIYSYIISLGTVAVLFVMAFVITTGNPAIQTSASTKELPIYSVNTQEKKVALTINCAWNADDVDQILGTLKKHNTKVTFFMVGDWVDKYRRGSKKNCRSGARNRQPF